MTMICTMRFARTVERQHVDEVEDKNNDQEGG